MTIRVATPLSTVDESIYKLRLLLGGAAIVGLGVAVLMSALSSHLLSGALRRLVENAHALAGGRRSRLIVKSRDELGRLAYSFNQMAEDLSGTVAELAEERDRFEVVLEGTNEAVLAVDGAERLTVLNPAASALLGLSDAAIGRAFSREVEHEELSALVSLAKIDAQEAELELAGSPVRYVLARATPLRASGGVAMVLVDVTRMRRLERIRKDFVANVSHELRTPVSVIRANAETLLDGALDEPQVARKFLEATLRNAERLSVLIADLLDLSRIEAGRYPLDIKAERVAAAVAGAVANVETAASEKRIAIEVDVPEQLRVLADAKALEQVLLNYLDNAVKYTPDGGTITVTTARDADRVRISVTDDGPGIAEKHRGRLFERFYRVDPGRSKNVGGTGLGLAIVKHLVESMNGKFGVEQAVPTGSVFFAEFAAAR